jgi:hypothetical protein
MFVRAIRGLFAHVRRSGSKGAIYRYCLLVLLLIPVKAAIAQTAAQFETPPTIRAQDLAPATLLNGNGFHVDEEVPTDGLPHISRSAVMSGPSKRTAWKCSGFASRRSRQLWN